MYEERQKGMIIAFVGIDGCGKSSLMNYVYESLIRKGYSVLNLKPNSHNCESSILLNKVKRTYLSDEKNYKRMLNEKIADTLAFELLKTSEQIKKQKDDYDFILLDRWAACQEIYDKVWFVWNSYIKSCLDLCIIPDITVCIKADLKLVEQRLKKRGNIKGHENMTALARINKIYNKFAKDKKWFTTENNSKLEVAGEKILELIEENINVEKVSL